MLEQVEQEHQLQFQEVQQLMQAVVEVEVIAQHHQQQEVLVEQVVQVEYLVQLEQLIEVVEVEEVVFLLHHVLVEMVVLV